MPSLACIMCKQTIDNRIQFGEKITSEDVTAHYFCLLLSTTLEQNGEDDEGIFGFLPVDIKKEAKRAKMQRCMFCNKCGANIKCCAKKCRRTFHFTCGSRGNCQFEFIDPFNSYCGRHLNFDEPEECHQSTDLCIICYDQMGEYNLVTSIQTPCCKTNWCHRYCLQSYADNAGYFCKCPGCNDSKQFRAHIRQRGVFIPDRDAKWEDTEMNKFYEFSQQVERPNECIAKNCKRSKHLNSNDDEEELLLCEYCGSKGVHERCLEEGHQFICDDCKPPPSKRRKLLHEPYESVECNELNGSEYTIADDRDHINNNIPINDCVQKYGLEDYKLRNTTESTRNITSNKRKRDANI